MSHIIWTLSNDYDVEYLTLFSCILHIMKIKRLRTVLVNLLILIEYVPLYKLVLLKF